MENPKKNSSEWSVLYLTFIAYESSPICVSKASLIGRLSHLTSRYNQNLIHVSIQGHFTYQLIIVL